MAVLDRSPFFAGDVVDELVLVHGKSPFICCFNISASWQIKGMAGLMP